MAVVEMGSERKGLEHVALDVDVAGEIGFGDVAFIERAQRPYRLLVAKADMELWVAFAQISLLAVRQLDGEGHCEPADAADQSLDCACG